MNRLEGWKLPYRYTKFDRKGEDYEFCEQTMQGIDEFGNEIYYKVTTIFFENPMVTGPFIEELDEWEEE